MPYAIANDIRIAFDTFGHPGAQPLLLVHGLGTQMIAWRPELCEALARRGYYVIRFDNRDIGLSERVPAPTRRLPLALVVKRRLHIPIRPHYGLDDMARDAIGLLDHLGVASAHVVGASMGAMIGQVMALEHPDRTRSLVSIMSSTGDRGLPSAPTSTLRRLIAPPPRTRAAWVEHQLRVKRVLASPRYFDDDETRRYLREVAERSTDRSGVPRQLAALLAAPGRGLALRRLRIPVTVMHGTADPLVPLEHGLATARAVPGARLSVVEGLGHDLPPAFWPRFLEEIDETASCSAARRAA